MSFAKKFAVGVVMTLITVAAGLFVVKKWAPQQIKDLFDVNAA